MLLPDMQFHHSWQRNN